MMKELLEMKKEYIGEVGSASDFKRMKLQLYCRYGKWFCS